MHVPGTSLTPYDPERHAYYEIVRPGRPLYSDVQLITGRRAAERVLSHGRYSYQDAAQIARCYTDNTPTLPRS